MVGIAIGLTLLCYLLAQGLGRRLTFLPVIVWAALLLMLALGLLQWPYQHYYSLVSPWFDHLLGYVVVALAIPLAAMDWRRLPLRHVGGLVVLASFSGVLLPVILAWWWHLATPQILAFVTRSITTPIALSVAGLIHAPPVLVSLIVIVSGLIGAAVSPWLLRSIQDERAAGLALGLVAHAIGTVEAWRRNPECGRFAALGMALNGVLTALWAPWAVNWFMHH